MQSVKNRRVVVTRHGGPEVIEVVDDELGPPSSHEVRLRMKAAGVAYGDVLKRELSLPTMPRPPYTPGYDVTGVVDAVGERVSGWAVGDRAVAYVEDGGNAAFVNVDARWLVKVPAGVDLRQVACLALNHVTAYQILRRQAQAKPGERLLVHGAAGGLGTAALELGKELGLSLYGTASARKHPVLERYGARAIDYRSEDFVTKVLELTGGDGVDIVIDPIGGKHLRRSHRVLRPGGRLSFMGASSALDEGTSELLTSVFWWLFYKLWPDGRRSFFYGINHCPASTRATIREDLAALVGLLAAGKLRPSVGLVLPLSQGRKAHEALGAAEVSGKLLLVEESPEHR